MLVHACLFSLERHVVATGDLPASELERAARFLREEDRRRYLLGRAALRRLCAVHLGYAPVEVPLREGAHGKPMLADADSQLHFNLAHSGECVALAWSVGHVVGIDVEDASRERHHGFREIAKSAFSPAEIEALDAAPADGLKETFFRIWVRKEAVVKAEGCGISGELQGFSVARRRAAEVEWPELVDYPGTAHPWRLRELAAPAGYQAAVAAPPECELRVARPEEILGKPRFRLATGGKAFYS